MCIHRIRHPLPVVRTALGLYLETSYRDSILPHTQTDKPFRILTLDGGGAKGFYTLGVLHEVEAMLGKPLHEAFDLIYGTSTGSIIGTLAATGRPVASIHDLYREHVPTVMRPKTRAEKSRQLAILADTVFGQDGFDKVKTGIGIVATKWDDETPLIFKADAGQAHGRSATFVPGFGCTLGEAVQASCAAYPFFEKVTLNVGGTKRLLFDGGYCANNPTLYAIADAVHAFKIGRDDIRVLNVGVGEFPLPKLKMLSWAWWMSWFGEVELVQKTFNVNAHSMEELRKVLFADVDTVRISEAYTEPALATDLVEHDLDKLARLYGKGRDSFGKYEGAVRALLM